MSIYPWNFVKLTFNFCIFRQLIKRKLDFAQFLFWCEWSTYLKFTSSSTTPRKSYSNIVWRSYKDLFKTGNCWIFGVILRSSRYNHVANTVQGLKNMVKVFSKNLWLSVFFKKCFLHANLHVVSFNMTTWI